MTRTILMTALAALALSQTAQAANAGKSLEACYSHVAKSCKANAKHPQACADAGMDACDDLHNAKLLPGAMSMMKIKEPRRTSKNYDVFVGNHKVSSFVILAKNARMDDGEGEDRRNAPGRGPVSPEDLRDALERAIIEGRLVPLGPRR